MRDLKNNLTTSGKSSTNIQSKKTKGFGYQVLGFGAGGGGAQFIEASGGTITTVDTDYKVHTFTGPGTFCVSAGSGPLAVVDYLAIAGGGGGAGRYGGGGGTGGFRESHVEATSGPYTASPLASASSSPVCATGYPITVGGGGAGGVYPGTNQGCSGANSIFSTITSAGGGGGGWTGAPAGTAGGSGGGAAGCGNAGGAGNTPPVSPPQGTAGGTGAGVPRYGAGGGGGAGVAGSDGTPSAGGNGGNGLATSITGSPVTRGGGGGGGTYYGGSPAGSGGTGGGGDSNPAPGSAGTTGDAGTVNTGSGGGGGGDGVGTPYGQGGAGGSGIVIIRYKFQ